MQHTYKILLNKEPEGGYMVTVPALPGCITQGDTVDEALSMAKEAIELYLEELQERGEMIPDNNDTLEYSINMNIAWINRHSILSSYYWLTAIFLKEQKISPGVS